MSHSLGCGKDLGEISSRNSTLSVEFIGDGVPLEENGDDK